MMWKIYLLGLLSNFQAFFAIAAFLLITFVLVAGMQYFFNEWYDDEDDKVGKWLKRGIVAAIFSVVMCMLIPSEKQMYAIIGIGGTLDYLNGNDKAKQIPDKVIDAVYKYLDNSKGDK